MRSLLFSLCLILCSFLAQGQDSYTGIPIAFASFSPREVPARTNPEMFTPEEEESIRQRLREMTCIIDVREHPVVESYLRGYLLRNREKSERILGRIPSYFPLFEEELRKAGLPDDLKYLAVVESALQPRALSRSGAGGLWQFMPGTGADFGLRIDNTVDQRGDPVLATRAAVAYLQEEYKRFGDWALVLAAYNSGAGRIRRALERSRKKDFWSIHQYLPRETRNYVPAFVAAMYLHKYGELHGLQAQPLSLDEQLPVSIPCPDGISLGEVAQATELPLELVRLFNSHCLQDFVPAGSQANCRVPARTAASLQHFLSLRAEDPLGPALAEIRARPIDVGPIPDNNIHYQVQEILIPGGTTLAQAAYNYGLSEHHLRLWNPGSGQYSVNDRTLIAYTFPGQNAIFGLSAKPASPLSFRRNLKLEEIARPDLNIIAINPPLLPVAFDQRAPNHRYTIQRYETLLDIWQRHANAMTWQEFVSWNSIDGSSHPVAGAQLFIRI